MAMIDYVCSECGAQGVKLWRQYQTFADHIDLMCRKHAMEDQDKTKEELEEYGDQIGWMVPAVPCEGLDTYWGYTSVPAHRCWWWYQLDGVARQASADPEAERLEWLERQLEFAEKYPNLFKEADVVLLESAYRALTPQRTADTV